MLDGDDTGLGEDLLGEIVNQLSVDETRDAWMDRKIEKEKVRRDEKVESNNV